METREKMTGEIWGGTTGFQRGGKGHKGNNN